MLHAYTGNTNDVRMLGRQLNWQGYTVFAPLLSGHGGDPRKVLESNGPGDWWMIPEWQSFVYAMLELIKLQFWFIARRFTCHQGS